MDTVQIPNFSLFNNDYYKNYDISNSNIKEIFMGKLDLIIQKVKQFRKLEKNMKKRVRLKIKLKDQMKTFS